MYIFKIRHTTSHPNTTISRTPNENGHNPKTINRSKFRKTCRNRRIFCHLRTRLKRTFKDIKDYIFLNGEKYRPQDYSPISFFSFNNLKNEILALMDGPITT